MSVSRGRLAILAIAWIALGCTLPAKPDSALARELAEMKRVDQEAFHSQDADRFRRVTMENAARLKQIVELQGWPDARSVGRDGAAAAWLIAQHADNDRDLQRRALAGLRAGGTPGAVELSQAAYLEDRIRVAEGKPQRFGTQGRCHGLEDWRPDPVESAADIDRLRRENGLDNLESYVAFASPRLCSASRMKAR